MSLGRLRRGEWLTLVGAVGLLVSLFFHWFGLAPLAHDGDFTQTGWSALGWALDVLLALAILAGIATAVTPALRQTPAWAVGAGVLAAPIGLLALVVLALRVFLFQPDLGHGFPNHLVDVQTAAYLGVAFCALIPVGAWVVLAD